MQSNGAHLSAASLYMKFAWRPTRPGEEHKALAPKGPQGVRQGEAAAEVIPPDCGARVGPERHADGVSRGEVHHLRRCPHPARIPRKPVRRGSPDTTRWRR